MTDIVKISRLERPYPPEVFTDLADDLFMPSPELEAWSRAVFIDEGSILGGDHNHLQLATIGFLWTNVQHIKQQRQILGTCELGQPQGSMGKWSRKRAEQQVSEWFGGIPDYLITIYTEFAREAADAQWVALIDHELRHAVQAIDAFGAPKFNQIGLPVWTIRSHDVEEFIGTVDAFGVDATESAAFVRSANSPPKFSSKRINMVCGHVNRDAV